MLPSEAESRKVLEEIQPLVTVLYAIVEAAIQEAHDYFSRVMEEVDGWCFSSIVRYRIKVALNKRGYNARIEEDSQEEGDASHHPVWQVEGFVVNAHYLMNNGLLLEYRGFKIRILKRHRRNLCYSTGTSRGAEEQMNLDFGLPVLEAQSLFIVWDVDAKYRLLGLELIKPIYQGAAPAQIKWSIPIPHPAELIIDEVDYEYKYDSDLPVPAELKMKKDRV